MHRASQCVPGWKISFPQVLPPVVLPVLGNNPGTSEATECAAQPQREQVDPMRRLRAAWSVKRQNERNAN